MATKKQNRNNSRKNSAKAAIAAEKSERNNPTHIAGRYPGDWIPECRKPFGNSRRNILPLDYNEDW